MFMTPAQEAADLKQQAQRIKRWIAQRDIYETPGEYDLATDHLKIVRTRLRELRDQERKRREESL